MKLLMITRKVDKDDAQAGFTYGWVKKIGQKLDKLYVITWQKSDQGDLPENIEINSLPKNKLWKIFVLWGKSIKILAKVDGVFCHQNPEYTILIAPYAKLFRKKIVTWYSHKAINWKVRLVNILANEIVTPTKDGFGLESNKKLVIGHGIDTELFKPNFDKKEQGKFRIISVGRISPIKDYRTLIEAISIIRDRIDIRVVVVGGPGLAGQQKHFEELKQINKEKGLENIIDFKGLIPNQRLPEYYQESDILVNLCPTGSPDKAVLEAMACGIPTLVANQTFRNDFGPYANQLIFKHGNAQDLAEKLYCLMHSDQLKEIGKYLREQVVKNHNLDNLMDKVINVFKEIN